MIYFCADDYGLCASLSKRIEHCVNEGALNKVSVFPNFDEVDFTQLLKSKNTRLSLHINLVEGKSMSGDNSLITDSNGNFKFAFGGLLLLSIFKKKQFEMQVYNEIKAQIMHWQSVLPKNSSFCVDSHQHTHMIPTVFKILLRVLREENIKVDYLRIPAEPIVPFLKTPSLYFTYSAVNLIKQWLLRLFWLINKPSFKKQNYPTAYFFGVLFSGKMDEKRVRKILPEYKKIAEKNNMDIEVLFHPGYIEEQQAALPKIVFKKFYLSENRKIEFDSAMKIHLKEV